MSAVARPNAWVAVEDDPSTQLAYAPRVHPAPLTVSVPGRDPVRGSLVVVITNQSPGPLAVSSIRFTVTVGQPGVQGTPLMPTTAGSHAVVSDTTTWSVTWPQQPITSGTADCVIGPQTGSSATLAAGASFYVEIYDFQTVQAPSTSTVIVAETIGNGDPAFTNINVSTFPDGFFFDGLTVNTGSAAALVPVAQVPRGSAVTLTWNSSVVDTRNQTVYWSSPTGGQQHATPTKLGEWSTPAGQPLTSDTVFVVVVQAAGPGDEPLTASLATAVSVQNPALVAASASVGGALTADSGTLTNALSAGSAAIKGALTADSGTVTNALAAGSGAIKGALSAGSAVIAGALRAAGATVDNALTAGSATINGDLQTGSLTTGTATFTSRLDLRGASLSILGAAQTIQGLGTYTAKADSLVVVTAPGPQMYPPPNVGYVVTGTCRSTTMYATGGYWSPINSQILVSSSFVLPVPAGQQFTLAASGGWGGQAVLALIPLGALPAQGPAFELVAEAPAPDRALEQAVAEATAQRTRAADELLALLDPFLARPLDDETKEKLADALRRA